MKQGWQTKTIGELFETGSGGTPLKMHKEYYEGGDIPWLRSGEVCKKYITETELFITRKGLENSSAKFFPPNSVVVAMYGATAGQVGILKMRTTTNQAVCGIFPSADYVPEFVYYSLLSKQKELVSQATGNAQPNISQIKIKNVSIPLLPLSEQQRIVALLDAEFAKIDALKANAEKNLQNAKDLFCSIQTKVLENKSWKRYSLDEICNLITDGTHRTPKYQQQGIPFLSVKNITGGFLDLDDTKYISEEEHRELVKRCKPEKGDVLYSKVGTTGVAQLIDTEEEFSIFVSLALLKVKQEIVKNTLLVKILNSPYVREQAKKRTRGTANKNFVISDIKAVDVLIPPYNEQDVIEQTIDTYWSKVSSLQANYEKTITLCDDLKQALLRKAFNGEI